MRLKSNRYYLTLGSHYIIICRFPDCKPSLAVAFEEVKIFASELEATIERMESLQKNFKNCCAIMLGKLSSSEFDLVNARIHGGSLRLMHARDWAHAIQLALSFYERIKPSEKHQLQQKYFEREAANLSSAEAARKVLKTTFSQLEISEEDTQIILEGFPTIAHVIDATEEEMQSNSPAEINSIIKITSFFGCDTPIL